MDQSRIALPDIELAYLEAGDPSAPLALCLHGFPDSAHGYDDLLPRLAEAGYHAVAPWMRGYNPSGLSASGEYEAPALGQDAIELTERLHGAAGQPVIIGHDWGAFATYGALALRPGLFRRAVTLALPHPMVAAQLLLGSYEQQKRSWYTFMFQVVGISDGIVASNDLAFLDRLIADWSPGWDRTETDRAHLREALGNPANVTAALSYYRASFNPAALSQEPAALERRAKAAGPITDPLMLLMGADDGCFSSELPEHSALFGGEYRFEVVDGAGHFMLQDCTEPVVTRILDWIGPPA